MDTDISSRNGESSQHLAVIDYWNTVEFFNFFDLSDAIRDLPPNSLFNIKDAEDMPWQNNEDAADYKYTIFLGVTNAKEISDVLPADENDVRENEKDKEKLTCIGKITLEEEGGVTRLDYVGLSTLNWAISSFLQKKIPRQSEFAEYQSSLLAYTNREICPHFAKRPIGSIPAGYIKRVYEHFLRSDHSHDKECDLWKPNTSRYIVLRENRKKTSHFLKYIKSHFKLTADLQQSAESLFRQYMTARSADDEAAMENASEGLLTFLAGLQRVEKNPVSIGQKFIDDMLAEIFSVREIEILNSFYLEDLEAAHRFLSRPRSSALLRSYLTTVERYTDLFSAHSKETLLEAVRPAATPPGRWPFEPAEGLSLMQQFAVNRALQQSSHQMFSVNGPPGTGKTTLCKDLIGSIIVKRAGVLAKLSHPTNAFDTRRTLDIKGFRFPALIDELVGFEILIASGNNGAVENISKALPLLKDLGREFQDQLGYLRACAQLFEDGDDQKQEKNGKTWGLFSVPLGNRGNIENFLSCIAPLPSPGQTFQPTDDIHSIGDWVNVENVSRRSFSEAQKNFQSALQKVELEKARLDGYFACAMRCIHEGEKYDEVELRLSSLRTDVEKCTEEREVINKKKTELNQIEAGLPRLSWMQRIFSRGKVRSDRELRKSLAEERLALFRRGNELEESLRSFQSQCSVLETELRSLEAAREEFSKMPSDLKKHAELLRLELDDPRLQIITPFQTEDLNRLRSGLFIAAMNLHEAWLEEVKRQPTIRSFAYNIRDILTQRKVKDSPAGRALFQVLFFFFPVISTTFAAARSFLRYVPVESLGWLVIDEAGQAVPQAAVGAILRSQRAMVVGDPLQLEPIITLPAAIQKPIEEHFKQGLTTAHLYDPFVHSVQTLADRSHCWGATIRGDQRLGSPLRVHRRCSNPMFSLSNTIAYDGKMILGKNDGIPNHPDLKSSCWFHMNGSADGSRGHWVRAQGAFALELLARIRRPRSGTDSVFVIAPFREVVGEFKQLVRRTEKSWSHDFPISSSWLKTSVGTVHTFQGKEADIVILLLGLDKVTRYSAQAIIESKPNFLNVAATRARKHFYIIGDVEIWRNVFSFDAAVRMLTVRQAGE